MPHRKQWPKTVEEAVEQLLSSMSEEYKEALKNTPDEDLILHHYGFGAYIRNEFGLWDNNKELLKSCGLQLYPDSPYNEYLPMMVHPDNASTKIIEATWRRPQ